MGRERRGKRVLVPGTVILKIMLRAFECFSFSSSYFFFVFFLAMDRIL